MPPASKLVTSALVTAVVGTGLWTLLVAAAAPRAAAQSPPPGAGARPDRPPPTLDDIAAIEAKHRQLWEQQKELEAKAREVEVELRDVRLRYERERTKERAAEAAKAVNVRHLAVAVVKTADPKAGPESAVCAVVETGAGGKPEGVLICSNLESLRKVLAWARHDPSAKWRVVVRPSGTSLEAQASEHAFGAAQAAGFEDVDYAADPAEAETAAALDRLGWKYPRAAADPPSRGSAN
jgi:hypothetical protein